MLQVFRTESAGSGGRGKLGRGEYEREGDRKKKGLTYSNPIKSMTSLRCLWVTMAYVLWVLGVRVRRGRQSTQKGKKKSSHLFESAQKRDLLAVLWCAADACAGGLQAAGCEII